MKEASTPVAHMRIDEDGILHITMRKGVHVTLEDAKEYYRISNELLQGKKALVLIDARERYTTSREALVFSNTEEVQQSRIAVALVTSSLSNRIMFSMYKLKHRPAVPAKMFGSRDKAIRWLRGFFVMPGDPLPRKKQ